MLEVVSLCVSAGLGLVVALWFTPQAGRLTNSLAVAGGLAILAAGVLAWAIGSVIGRRATRRRRRRTAAVLAALVMCALAVWITRPPHRLYPPLATPPGVLVWELSTGSRIAYHYTPARAPRRPSPVLLLHGGPGIPALPALEILAGQVPFDSLSALGFDTYYYDQYGAGYSSRADLTRDPLYTVARHVADLEAIRSTIGAEKLILIGFSWGATLAANYVLHHPDRVERVVFVSPGPIWYPEYPNFDISLKEASRPLSGEEKAAMDRAQQPTARIATGRMLGQINPRLGTALVADWEVDQWFGRMFELSLRLGQTPSFCRDDREMELPPEFLGTVGFFVSTFTQDDAFGLPDPRPELRKRTLPALVLRGECDWIRPEVAAEYKAVFPSARLVALPGEGHVTWMIRPGPAERIVAAFLLDEEISAAGRDSRNWAGQPSVPADDMARRH